MRWLIRNVEMPDSEREASSSLLNVPQRRCSGKWSLVYGLLSVCTHCGDGCNRQLKMDVKIH